MRLRASVLVNLLLCLALETFSLPSARAESQLGADVYKSVSEAVFLLETLGDEGKTVAIGSAFLVDEKRLVTNYHVIQGGRVYLRVGSVRIDCSVAGIDPVNDLALLSVQGSITAKPLAFARSEAPVGSAIFVLGNPAGLERTISQGLLSGKRQIEGRSLLQISAAISPGSSGGPVVNQDGEVVGVTVAFLREGQNLNFAVPASFAVALLAGKSQASLDGLLEKIKASDVELKQTFSGEDFDESGWKVKSKEVDDLFHQALALAAGSTEKLLTIARVASDLRHSGIAIEAAGSAIQLSKTPLLDAHRLLALNLQASSWFLEDADKKKRLDQAEMHARKVLAGEKRPQSGDYLNLANILESAGGDQAEAYAFFKKALEAAKTEKGGPFDVFYRGLSRTSRSLGRRAEALVWLKAVTDEGSDTAFDWESTGEILGEQEKFAEAGDAWLRSASLVPTAQRFCKAGVSYWLSNKSDDALAAYRKCVEKATVEKDSEVYTQQALSTMSAILFDRGVYDESVNLAKQAVGLNPNDGFAFINLSRGLNALKRSSEAIVAAQSAIRLTDGRFGYMHFALGEAYFDSGNWDLAARAFQKAAELVPADGSAAYNVAVSMQRQGLFADAAHWYEEALRRNPNHPEREEILKRIRTLRK